MVKCVKLIGQIDAAAMALVHTLFALQKRNPSKQQGKKYWLLIVLLARAGVTPNFISFLALALTVLAGGFVLREQLTAAAALFALSWFFSYFDGVYARQTGAESRFGELFNDAVNIVCDLFLLAPLLLSCIFTVNDFLVIIMLALLVWRVIILIVGMQLKYLKVKNTEVFWGRAWLWWLFIFGLLLRLLPLAAVASCFLLTISGGQLLYQVYLLHRSAPKLHIKVPAWRVGKKNTVKTAAKAKPAKRRKPK